MRRTSCRTFRLKCCMPGRLFGFVSDVALQPPWANSHWVTVDTTLRGKEAGKRSMIFRRLWNVYFIDPLSAPSHQIHSHYSVAGCWLAVSTQSLADLAGSPWLTLTTQSLTLSTYRPTIWFAFIISNTLCRSFSSATLNGALTMPCAKKSIASCVSCRLPT